MKTELGFLLWLSHGHPNRTVGIAKDGRRCPLREYMQVHSVGVDRYATGGVGGPVEWTMLPKWAWDIVVLVDRIGGGPVTARQILEKMNERR